MAILPAVLYAQQKTDGLSYIDTLYQHMQNSLPKIAQCLPSIDSAEYEITSIGSEYFCVVSCPLGYKLYHYSFDEELWVQIRLCRPYDAPISVSTKVERVYASNGKIFVTLSWSDNRINEQEESYTDKYTSMDIPLKENFDLSLP